MLLICLTEEAICSKLVKPDVAGTVPSMADYVLLQ